MKQIFLNILYNSRKNNLKQYQFDILLKILVSEKYKILLKTHISRHIVTFTSKTESNMLKLKSVIKIYIK